VGKTRATVQEAARILGISEGTIRKRVKRGTLPHDKGEDGRVYVYLDTGTDDGTDGVPHHANSELISAKDETIHVLTEQLEAERQAHAEARRLLAAALERIPLALEAPREPPGNAETPEEEEMRLAERERTRRLQRELTEAREQLEEERSKGLWRRLFGR
jgi:excisionase family DNA binding protein